MRSINDLKAEIDKLDAESCRRLEKWFTEEEHRRKAHKDCFVIMPFSETRDYRNEKYWSHFFDNFLKPVLAECGFRATKSQANEDNFVAKIMEELGCADVVLAVLTDDKPNVWYELGVRHSQRLGTVMIRQEGQRLPSDLSNQSTAFYPESLEVAAFVPKLREYLTSASKEAKDSPVASFLSSNLVYCINRAVAARRSALNEITAALEQKFTDEQVLTTLRGLDKLWEKKERQLTIVDMGADRVLAHRGDLPHSKNGRTDDPHAGWVDLMMNGQSLYPHMKTIGSGLRLASIERCHERITAIAFEKHPAKDWLVIAEAHVQQGQLG